MKMRSQAENQHRKGFLGIPWIEWGLAISFFAGLFLLLAKFAGGPLVSDDYYYLDAGLNGYKDILVLFYYAHIYFQRIFTLFTASPLVGGKYYWAFTVAVTAAAIYLASRLLNKKSTWLNAALASALFLSLNYLSKYSGVNKNDFTAMMIVALIVVVFILAERNGFRNPILLGLLGFLYFFAFKSKETAVLVGFIFLGFGFNGSPKFEFRRFLGRIPVFLAGFAVGIGVFAILNQLFVGDALWGIRPADFAAYLNVTGENARFMPVDDNFLSGSQLTMLIVPFLLYLIFGITLNEDFSKPKKLVWSYPLVLIVFLTVALIFASGFATTDRFFFPALPALCIFASQVIPFHAIQGKRDWIFLGISMAGGLLIGVVLLQVMFITTTTTKYTWSDVTLNLIQPIFLSIFLISYAWKKPTDLRSIVLPVICLTILLFQPLYLNFHSIVIEQPNNKKMAQLLYPFSAFSQKLTDIPGAIIYISPNISKEDQMLSKKTDEIRSMFNVYFGQNLGVDNFINPTVFIHSTGTLIYPDPLETLPKMNFRYAFITATDWERIRQNPQLFAALSEKYDINFDDAAYLGLLSEKVK